MNYLLASCRLSSYSLLFPCHSCLGLLTLFQSGRMEAPASTLQEINVFRATLQNISVNSATQSQPKIAAGKKVPQNTSEYGNF